MRAPPSGPCEQDWIATGLPSNGCSFMRETQSIAFFNPPGIDQLYSGVTNSAPSPARIAVARSSAGAGKPEAFGISALYSGGVSNGGAVTSFISGGANSGNARVNAALYEPLRNEPQITSTLSLSFSAIASPSNEIPSPVPTCPNADTILFGFDAGCLGDLLKPFYAGFDNFAKFGRRRQVGERPRSLKPFLDGVFGQHLFHRLVQLGDDRLRSAGGKHKPIPAEVGDPRYPALRQCRNILKSRPSVRRGHRDQTQIA